MLTTPHLLAWNHLSRIQDAVLLSAPPDAVSPLRCRSFRDWLFLAALSLLLFAVSRRSRLFSPAFVSINAELVGVLSLGLRLRLRLAGMH